MDRHASPPEVPVSALAEPGYVVRRSAGRVRDLPERLRPREEARRIGIEHVSDRVLLAVLLRTGARGCNVVDLAEGLLRRYGTLSALAAAREEELARIKGVGRVKAQMVKAALEIGRRLSEEALPPAAAIRTPSDVADLLRSRTADLAAEVFWVLCLDTRNRLKTKPVQVSRGLMDASLVHPREVFQSAIAVGAAAVVLAHNHPSGDPAPSAEDVRITRQLVESGKIIDIRVLDHVVLGRPGREGSEFLSLREEGLVRFEG